MRVKSIVLSILFLICSYALADTENPNWFTCQKDSDCVNISYACSGGNVNKKFATEANKYYSHRNAISNCQESPKNKDTKLPAFKVFCKKKKCESQGKNPKRGFS